MSNIIGIDFVSDLLTISEQSYENEDSSKNKSTDNINNVTLLNSEIFYNEKLSDTKDIFNELDNDLEKDEKKTDDYTSDKEQNELFNSLLNLHKQKSLYIEQQNLLLKKRSDYKNSIHDLKHKIKEKRKKKEKEFVDNELNNYLEKNKHILSISDDPFILHKNENVELNKIDVLPSENWDERIKYIYKMYPNIKVNDISISYFYHTKNILIRSVKFFLVSENLFKVPIQLLINSLKGNLIKINFFNTENNNVSSKSFSEIDDLFYLSSSFTKVLISNFIPNKRIDKTMHGFNSLSNLIHKRSFTIYELVKKYYKYIKKPDLFMFCSTKKKTEYSPNIFNQLKHVNNLNFQLVNKKQKTFEVCFFWNIELKNLVSAKCESKFNLCIYNKIFDSETGEIKTFSLNNVNFLFLESLKSYSLMDTFQIFFEKIFYSNEDIPKI